MQRLGDILAIMGFAGFILSALTMVAIYVTTLFNELGTWGLVFGVVSAPAAAIFPFLDWLVTGSPSMGYFALWGVGMLGMVWSMWWKWRVDRTA